MFIGHALLAFALATLVADRLGWSARKALALGVATGAFAAIPDVDVSYALVAMEPGELIVGTQVKPSEFWGSAHGVHRSMTHSLVAAAVAGPAFGLWAAGWPSLRREERPSRRALATVAAAVLALATLIGGAWIADGLLGAAVMGAFLLSGLAVAVLSRSWLALSPTVVALAAIGGIASHPWGDLVTGEPPGLLYPIEIQLLPGRVMLSADPTLHLLGAFAIELGAISLAAIVLARHADLQPRTLVDRRAGLGVVYGAAAVVLVPPTIHLAYHFVGSIVLVGAVCGGLRWRPFGSYSVGGVRGRLLAAPEEVLGTVFTALAGIAIALVSYGVVYVLVG